MPNTFSGDEFARRLLDGSLKEPIVKVGMAKAHGERTDKILFAEGGACGEWIELPIHLLEHVTFLKTVSCKDHRHPLVMIQFREPAADNPEAQAFADLLRAAARQAPSNPVSGPPSGGVPGTAMRIGGGAGAGGFGGSFGNPGYTCFEWRTVCNEVILYTPSGAKVPIWECHLECAAGVP